MEEVDGEDSEGLEDIVQEGNEDRGECPPADQDCIYAITLSAEDLAEIYEHYDDAETIFYIIAAGAGLMSLLSVADPPLTIALGIIAAYSAWEAYAAGELADFFYSAAGEATQNGGSTTITLSSGFALSTTGNPASSETLFSVMLYSVLDLLRSYAP